MLFALRELTRITELFSATPAVTNSVSIGEKVSGRKRVDFERKKPSTAERCGRKSGRFHQVPKKLPRFTPLLLMKCLVKEQDFL
jgi:hypothetical protein